MLCCAKNAVVVSLQVKTSCPLRVHAKPRLLGERSGTKAHDRLTKVDLAHPGRAHENFWWPKQPKQPVKKIRIKA